MGHDVWGPQRKTPSRNIGPLVPCAADNSGTGAGAGAGEGEGGDKPATEAVLKLYTAIKDRNVRVLAFLSSLMTAMGKRIEFVVQPTPLGGVNVGIQWKLEFDHTSVPFGKGFSFYTVHVYQGKAYVRNADTFIEPIVHSMEPFLLRLAAFLGPLLGVTVLHQKWAAFFRPIVERVSPIIKHKRTRAFIYCLLTLVTMCTLLTILKRSLS
ncbi:hypothetical protein AAC387_Pa09g2447 [Persea americana]